jgi:TonB-linked SusC/RagA family outer membrane protein
MNGKFTIEVPNAGSKLVLSYVGYTTETVAVSGTEMNVQLVPDIRSLEEVVVIGYGAAKQKDLTGAIATVKSDEIKKLPVTTMSEALQGLAPGVQVTNQDGRPGSSVSVKIRGVGTFGDNTPLYVVDGYPVGGQATYIAPEDIASMTILKDASAIAIYGSRASNGVVLITTKRGETEGLTVDFSANFTNQFAPKKIDLMNAEQFAKTAVEIGNANGLVYPDSWKNPSSLKNIDWQDEVFNSALKQNYNLAIRGGNDKTKAALSLSYLDHQGIVYRSFYKRYGVGLNVDQKIGKRILLTSSIKYAFNTSQARIGSGTGSIGNIIENIPFMEGNPKTNEVKDGAGNYGYYEFREETKSSVNFIAQADENDQNNGNHDILGTLAAEIELLKGMKFKTNLGLNIYSGYSWNFYPKMARGEDLRTEAQYNQTSTNNKEYLWENTLSYNRTFGIHSIDAVAGVSSQENLYIRMDAQGVGYPSNEIRSLLGSKVQINSGYQDKGSLASTFGRLSYRLKERYLLTGTVRRDGSSKFASDYKYGVFPSVGLGWVVSEESFMKGLAFVDNLKIRGSWGEAGNQRIAPYMYLSTWSTGSIQANEGYVLGTDQARVTGIAVQNLPQKDLTWETTEQTNFGFDGYFFNNKLSVTVDYYEKKSRDFLLNITLPAQSGFTSAYRNAGSIQNKGMEFSVGYNNSIGDFKWSANANLTTVKNEVLELAPGLDNLSNTSGLGFVDYGSYQWINFGRTIVGGEVGEFFGWVNDGIFQTQAEIDQLNAAATASAGKTAYYETSYTQPGDRKFKDLNGDNQITDADRKIIGSPIPDYYGGLTLSGSYKSFDFSLFVFGSFGNDILNYQKKNLENMGRSGRTGVYSNASVDFMNNRWTGPGTSNTMTRGFLADNNGNNRISDYYVEDGSYVRLKNIQFGYTLPSALSKKLLVKSARIYISGQNLLTFTKYTGWDPEIGDNDGVRNSGVDVGTYPVARSVSFGFNLTF